MPKVTRCIPIEGDLLRIGIENDDGTTLKTTLHWPRYQAETEAILADLPKGAKRDDATRLRVWIVREVKKAIAKLPQPE